MAKDAPRRFQKGKFSPDAVQVGKNISSLRRSSGLSQSGLSKRAGISLASVSSLERGINSPSLETIVRLAYALDLKPSTLISFLVNDDRVDATQQGVPILENQGLKELIASLGNACKLLKAGDRKLISSFLIELSKKVEPVNHEDGKST